MSDPFPTAVDPMLASPAATLPSGEGWAFEVKWDGVRAIAFIPPRAPSSAMTSAEPPLRLIGRRGTDYTPRYPELAGLAGTLASGGAILDGEVVALDDSGLPSFERLQHRMHLTGPDDVRIRQAEIPVQYAVFDALWLNGVSLMDRRWDERRAALDSLPLGRGQAWQLSAAQIGGGPELQEATRRIGLEGILAKRLDSRYESGRRSRSWLKVKNVRRQEVVVGGWMEGARGRSGQLGALLIGVYDEAGELQPAGKVGTGFTQQVLVDLGRRLAELAVERSPFARPVPNERSAHFAQPELVAEVGFTEWTTSGTLRHPSYLGLRTDVEPRQVRREPDS